ncbi:hypothetical protein HZB01_03965, partial [Candidatus Woesearchaeota archaeon]|nr:hypothetical protein [Candidatus Woesearchaeota archaeon]
PILLEFHETYQRKTDTSNNRRTSNQSLDMGKFSSYKIKVSLVRHYLLLVKNGKVVYVKGGKEAQAIVDKEIQKIEITAKQVNGLPASAGKAIGCARIIYTAHDLKKVKKGDIMIAVTTHPDFVPAMQASAAIVTDQGGMTSHAAIVAREFKKPCVVGTRLATKVFRDGDMIEVDAVMGTVRLV